MGKYMRKFNGIGEVAAMEMAHVGVRTRARALAMAASATRSKIGRRELKLSPSLMQLRSRRRPIVTPRNSVSPLNSGPPQMVSDDRCSSLISDNVTTSCCSSNASSEFTDEERCKVVDPEDDDRVRIETHCRERRENTPSSEMEAESGELESTARPLEANSPSEVTSEKSTVETSSEEMPSDAEIEEFFAAAEKVLEKQFTEKYNFDFTKFEPLEGRYEWVRVSHEEENKRP
ncbi:hypothetical protein Vadar_014248 [Vaccinium darrowii]|uniref:Uncharacterized protein n=1 Tax=Vaccinium darrowii TaxID=229202 RepID=A0ACB7XZL3_9ERIC|nr:hypothetical protein Vadar_014248 [Vaccinium darrowii]